MDKSVYKSKYTGEQIDLKLKLIEIISKTVDEQSIKNLGEITTQEELDNLVRLDVGTAKFKCAGWIAIDSTLNLKFRLNPYPNTGSTYYIITNKNDYYISQRLISLHHMAPHLTDYIRHCNYDVNTDTYSCDSYEEVPTIRNGYLYVDELETYGEIHANALIQARRDFEGYGKTWFANTPKIGGVSYDDSNAEDVMSIKDLGIIDTTETGQEQLDSFIALDNGWATFICDLPIHYDDTAEHKWVTLYNPETDFAMGNRQYVLHTIKSLIGITQYLYTGDGKVLWRAKTFEAGIGQVYKGGEFNLDELQTVTDLGILTGKIFDEADLNLKETVGWYTFTLHNQRLINIYDTATPYSCDGDYTYRMYVQLAGEDADGNYYKQFTIYDTIAGTQDDSFGIAITTIKYDSSGTTLLRLHPAIMNNKNIKCSGNAWFKNPIKIGGTSYNDATAADVMSIRDLGVIDTQQQLDELQHLPTGYAKFKSKYGVYANNNTFVLSDEVHHGVAYFEYLLETIQSPTEYVVQFLKTSNYSQLQPMFIFRRYHRVAMGNGTYSISNYSSGNFLANGDSLDFTNGVLTDVGEFTMNALRFLINGAVEFSDNAKFKDGALFSSGNVMFDVDSNVSFWHPPKTRNKIAAKEVPIAYTAEYRGLSTETNPVFAFSYGAMDTDTVYGVIESLTLEWSAFPGLSGDSSIGIHFDTGDTPPSISYSIPHGNGETLNWIGTDCALQDGLSIFAPTANKHYDIYIYNNGTQYVAMVNGFTPATAN